MKRAPFFELLQKSSQRAGSLLCVGLDPQVDAVAAEDIFPQNRRLIDATCQSACLYKPNAGFYEARGAEGMDALRKTIDYIHAKGMPVLLDAKRGDISSTAAAYAKAVFEVLDADGVTLNPLLGADSVEPFLQHPGRGLFLLCHTSNPGARDLQELDAGGMPFYERIALAARAWNTRGTIGLVIGATFPDVLARVRAIAADMWFLLPGVGSQGGDLEASVAAGLDAVHSGVIVNVSRGVAGAADPAQAARELRDRIQAVRVGAAGAGSPGAAAGAPVAAAADPLVEQIALGLFDLGAVRFGQFTLKSGKSSPIYIDLRLLVSDPGLMALVARALAGILSGLRFDRIAAIPYGGLPIGQAASLASGVPLIYPRREAKDYGTKKLIEGRFSPGETVVVLDDLVTTGGSKLEVIAPLSDAGLKVADVAVLVDREQGGREELAAHGLALHSVLTLSTLLDILVRRGRIDGAVRSDVRQALNLG
jgi:uridine monophosphate synthetase